MLFAVAIAMFLLFLCVSRRPASHRPPRVRPAVRLVPSVVTLNNSKIEAFISQNGLDRMVAGALRSMETRHIKKVMGLGFHVTAPWHLVNEIVMQRIYDVTASFRRVVKVNVKTSHSKARIFS